MSKKKSPFKQRIIKELKDRYLRANFKWVMDSLVSRRKEAFANLTELNQLRDLGQSIRLNALIRLPELLEKLEHNCQKNGIQIHWAETGNDANNIILDIAQKHNASLIIKGKSMASEEIHLNDFLANHNIQSIESDLGEYIIQLADEKPYHIIVPAIHKDKDQIAKLFEQKVPHTKYTEHIEELTLIARNALREKFYNADIGISGVNFAVAETGTLCLVENEGNGRMCTTIPPVHIAIMGIEKVVEKLSDLPPLLKLLTRSATGQAITTYFNMITSPRKPEEKDGPNEVHLIILDNGRSNILSDKELLKTLSCIRCGACLNHCPVYIAIGGHGYGYVYPGPIGKVLSAQMMGIKEAGELPTASSLCGACQEVCPVRIPLTDLLLQLRKDGMTKSSTSPIRDTGSNRTLIESFVWKGWQIIFQVPFIHRFSTWFGSKFLSNIPLTYGILKNWAKYRTPLKLSKKTLHNKIRKEDVTIE